MDRIDSLASSIASSPTGSGRDYVVQRRLVLELSITTGWRIWVMHSMSLMSLAKLTEVNTYHVGVGFLTILRRCRYNSAVIL